VLSFSVAKLRDRADVSKSNVLCGNGSCRVDSKMRLFVGHHRVRLRHLKCGSGRVKTLSEYKKITI